MTIFHPLNMPVAGEALADAARNRLALSGEWTPWQEHVLRLIVDNADAIVDFVNRHSWERGTDSPPDPVRARIEIDAAFRSLIATITTAHMVDGDDENSTGQTHDFFAVLGLTAWQIADDLLAGLRRGDATLGHARIHGLDHAETVAWLHGIAQEEMRALPRDRFQEMDVAADAFYEAGRQGEAPQWAVDAIDRRNDILIRHAEAQARRNDERVQRVVDATNDNFAIPDGFAMRFVETVAQPAGHVAIIDWGTAPTRTKSSFKRIREEVMTRPYGRHAIPLRLDSLGEISAFPISEIARAGHHVGLILGRDAEIVAAGSPLSQPPPWCRAAAIPVVAEIAGRLQRGDNVSLNTPPFREMGAVIGMDLQLDQNGSRYQADGETLLEVMTFKGELPATLALACYGLPMSRIVEHPVVGRDDVFVEWMEIGDGETVIGLRSALIRVMAAPEGHEQNPTVAWLHNVRTFDEAAVYGDRRYRDRDANPDDPLDVHAPFADRKASAQD